MSGLSSFDYALIRVVPLVERGECVNVGAILYCRTRRFLAARVELEPARVRALDPGVDLDLVRAHLDALVQIAASGRNSGPIGQLSQAERFHWLVAPRSTMIQVSPVHSGLCADPAAALERVVATLVRRP